MRKISIMKKLFVVSLAVSAVFFSSAQQLVDDFETTSLNWQNVSCYFDIRANDYKTDANMSDKVLYVQRDAACDNWSGAIYTPETPIAGYDYLHVMMYRNNTHQPNLKVADSHPTEGAVDLLPMNEIVSGAWQDVVFNISDFEAVDFIMFMVDRTELTETAWMLCDEVMLSNDPTPRTTIEVGGDDSDEDNNNASSDEIGTGETDGYHLVWADYFNDGELDEETWNIEVNGNGGGNNELQYYRAENVSVGTEPISGKGCLILTAQKEEFGGKHATSGRINSKNKLYFKHGKIEASVKMPRTANGLWPAFWMMGNDYDLVGWPKCGEIDILEMGNAQGIQNGTQDRYFNGACHWGFYKDGAYPNYGKSTTNSYDMQDDFHLFTLYWDQNEVRMYLDQDKYPDAEPYYVMGISDTNGDWANGNYFHKSFFVLFNLAVGGNFTGIWDINQITALNNGPASMYVDFVKIYQKGTDDETFMDEGTGLMQTEEDNFSCYPNPTCDVFSFSAEAQRVVVTDLTGRVIYEAENVSKVDARNWVAGIYMAKVQINDKIYTKQIIKK